MIPDARTYVDNASGTFNLFQVCADLGILGVISASSAQVYGFHKYSPIHVGANEALPPAPGELLRGLQFRR